MTAFMYRVKGFLGFLSMGLCFISGTFSNNLEADPLNFSVPPTSFTAFNVPSGHLSGSAASPRSAAAAVCPQWNQGSTLCPGLWGDGVIPPFITELFSRGLSGFH